MDIPSQKRHMKTDAKKLEMSQDGEKNRHSDKEQRPYKTFPEHPKKGVIVRVFRNPGHRYSNWSWDIIQRGTSRTEHHYMSIDSLAVARKALAEAERFMKRRQWFLWFFKMID